MAQTPTVAVVGMKAFMRDVVKMSGPQGELTKAMVAAARSAAEPVAAVTRSSLPQTTGRLAGDVRVTASRSGAGVRMGRSSLRYAGWVEFGGTRRAPHESVREYDSRGRYLFPAALSMAPQAAQRFETAATKALEAYRWTNESTDPGGVRD
jgi:bacteriophage HK97-gp10 putative tail-component